MAKRTISNQTWDSWAHHQAATMNYWGRVATYFQVPTPCPLYINLCIHSQNQSSQLL